LLRGSIVSDAGFVALFYARGKHRAAAKDAMARRSRRSAQTPRPQAGLSRRLARVLKLAWWAACIGVLLWWWISVDFGAAVAATKRSTQRELLEAAMAVLAFPAGLLWVWLQPIINAGLAGIGVQRWPWYGPVMLTWSGAALLGYLQWFWVLPHVFALRASDA
jgi:hypothetical protein